MQGVIMEEMACSRFNQILDRQPLEQTPLQRFNEILDSDPEIYQPMIRGLAGVIGVLSLFLLLIQ